MQGSPVMSEGFPRRFGPYVLLSSFAHGGMGAVYLAKRGGIAGIDRLCVLKKLRPDLTQNAEYVRRFIDEARLAVQLNHANICHTFDVGRVGNEYYLAMEYVSGVNLRALQNRARERGRTIPEGAALFILCEVLEALDYAHRLEHPMTGKPLNLVHRDVSPQNVMVSFEGEVKLVDFGLAASELKEEQTESQMVMGKVAYMSPEQARGEKVTPHTDQFAAAIVGYELFAGERFYGEMSNYQIWQVVGRGGFTPRRWAELSPELLAVLARALHGDPAQRFPTCGDFKDALQSSLVSRYPATNRRAVRSLLRELFEGDTARERSFLARFADGKPPSATEVPKRGPRTVSLFLPSSKGEPEMTETSTSASAKVIDATEPVPKRRARAEPESESTATHARKARMRRELWQKQRIAAGALLVLTGAVGGYLGVQALRGQGAEPARKGAAASTTMPPAEQRPPAPAPEEPEVKAPSPPSPAKAPAPSTKAAEAEPKEARGQPSAAPAREDKRERKEKRPRPGRQAKRAMQPHKRDAEPQKAKTPAPAPPTPARAARPRFADDPGAWRSWALFELARCEARQECARIWRPTLLERPATAAAAKSIEDCIHRCR